MVNNLAKNYELNMQCNGDASTVHIILFSFRISLNFLMYISPRTFPDLFSTPRIKYIYYILDEMFVKITHLKDHLLEFRIGACKAQAHKQSATNLFIKIILRVFLCGEYGMPRTRLSISRVIVPGFI